MNTKIKKVLCAAAALVLVGAAGVGISSAVNGSVKAEAAAVEDVVGTKRYVISSPYRNVDWDTWGRYKGATHVHTNISDGDIDFDDMVENYYMLGYDCLAITDHGTVNYGWSDKKSRHTLFAYQAVVHGSAKNVSSSRYAEIVNGVGRNGQPMIDIPLGIELNGSSISKTHVNGFFADAGDGDMEMDASGVSGAVKAVKKTHKAGGITHINHVGEWMSANDEDTLAGCKSNVYTQSFINEFTQDVFRSFDSCIGMELVNKSDSRTKWDRYLYDELLMRLAPEGRTLFGFCEDDSHDEGEIAKNAQFFMMPANTADNVRTCMESGAFFASSVTSRGEMINSVGHSDFQIHNYPKITRITTDDTTSQITFNVQNANHVVLITGGKNLGDGTLVLDSRSDLDVAGDTVTFDLNNYEDQLTKGYVRVYFDGPDGLTYVQPFYLTTTNYTTKVPVSFHVTLNGETASNPSVILRDSNGVLIPMESNTTVNITKPDTYTYAVCEQGTDTTTGSFTITDADFVNERSYSFDVNIEDIPELIINTDNNIEGHLDTRIITGLQLGNTLSENVAVSSSSRGTVEVVPTASGYGTGTKVNLLYKGEVIDSYTYVIYGDTDGDAECNAADSIKLQAFLKGKYNHIDEATLRACDVNGDGLYDSTDVQLMRSIGMLVEYNIDQNR